MSTLVFLWRIFAIFVLSSAKRKRETTLLVCTANNFGLKAVKRNQVFGTFVWCDVMWGDEEATIGGVFEHMINGCFLATAVTEGFITGWFHFMRTSVNVKESWFSQGRFPESCTGTPSSSNDMTYYKKYKKRRLSNWMERDRILLF